MFKFEFFVEDKHVLDLMRALAGKAHNLQVVPVLNAMVEKGKDKHRSNGVLRPKGQGAIELFITELRKNADTVYTPNALRQVCELIGFSRTSYSYFIRAALKARAIKKGKKLDSGTGFTYHVQPEVKS